MSETLEQLCPICRRPVGQGYPESLEFDGQTVHTECVAQAQSETKAKPKGWNPNNSYT